MDAPEKKRWSSMLFYRDWWEYVKRLSPQQRLETLDALLLYAFDDMLPSRPEDMDRVFLMIEKIKRDREKFEQVSQRRREAAYKKWGKRPAAEPEAEESAAEEPAEETPQQQAAPPEVPAAAAPAAPPAPAAPAEADALRAAFEEFRKAYPGRKRGLDTELANLRRRADWREAVPQLMPALERMLDWRRRALEMGAWVPDWPMLQTWINQARWSEELPEPSAPPARKRKAPAAAAESREAARARLLDPAFGAAPAPPQREIMDVTDIFGD